MMGFGVRMNQVFSSRWKALLWSAGVLMTAYCSVPSREETEAAKDQPAIMIPDLPDLPAQPPGPGFQD